MLCLQRAAIRCLALALLLLFASIESPAYSVLTHEEVIDLLWRTDIYPLLVARFPKATPQDMLKAHAYAYGGCVIQDLGYYPFGSKDFSNLVHYVRSGDFVTALLEESQDLNEYAFALGALSHYTADLTGHPRINQSVAIVFPKLRKRFGNSVTYNDDPKAHIRTEFGFDVAQVAKHRYAPEAYHDFIGFEVAKPLLERAFLRTYGTELGDVFANVDLSIGTYRRSISKMIPELTKAALLTHSVQLAREIPNFDRKKFVYNMSRASYEKEWGHGYRRPGIGARILAFLFKLVPKIGPFRAVDFQTPTTQTENLYFKSVNDTVDGFRGNLRQLRGSALQLPNRDFDTGKETVAGEYELTDKTYADLLHRLAKHKFDKVEPDLRSNLLNFFGNTNTSLTIQHDKKRMRLLASELPQLRAAPTTAPLSAK